MNVRCKFRKIKMRRGAGLTLSFASGSAQRVFERERNGEIPANELIHIGRGKRLASSVFYSLAALWRARARWRHSNSRRILVLEPVGLGDMISFEPLVRELLRREYEVILCSKPEWRPLFPDRPNQQWLNMRLPWASHNEKIKYRLGLYFQEPARGDLSAMRKAASGATGIDTRGDIRSVLLLYWAGCSRVISLSNYLGSDVRMWPSAAEIVPFDNGIRRWELNARFLARLDPSADLGCVTSPRLDHLISKRPARRVGLMPIAPWAGKLWPAERWKSIAAALVADGWEVVAYCGPKQSERARQQVGGDVPVIECGSIEGWAREFNGCSLVISLDSGPMHLADALDVPVIALFGQGKLPLWAPSGKLSRVIAHRDSEFFVCHPVDANTVLGQKYMNKISEREVIDAAREILAELERTGPPS
jgi:hypothetical protein